MLPVGLKLNKSTIDLNITLKDNYVIMVIKLETQYTKPYFM